MIARGWAGHVRYYGFRGYCGLVVALMVAPMLVLVALGLSREDFLSFPPGGLSFSHFAPVLFSPEWRASLANSLIIALVSALLATLLGTMSAIGLARAGLRFWGVIAALVVAPIVLPTVVWALGLHFLARELGLVGSFGALILAHTVLTAPLVFVAVTVSLRSVSPRLLQAAHSLGAEQADVFRTIVLPLVAPGIVSGAAIAFVVSLGDLVLALLLGGNELRTLPVAMFEDAQLQVDTSLAAVATLFLLAAVLVAAMVELFRRWHDRLWGAR